MTASNPLMNFRRFWRSANVTAAIASDICHQPEFFIAGR